MEKSSTSSREDTLAFITTKDEQRVLKPVHAMRISFPMYVGLHIAGTTGERIETQLAREKGFQTLSAQHELGRVGTKNAYLLYIDDEEVSTKNLRRTFSGQIRDMTDIRERATARPQTLHADDVDLITLYNLNLLHQRLQVE